MSLSPSRFNTGHKSSFTQRITQILGLCLAVNACDSNKTDLHDESTEERMCHKLIKDGRERIFCIVDRPREPKKKLRHVSKEEIEFAEAKAGERVGNEAMALYQYGGHLFNMRRIPGMSEECPTVMGKGENGTPTKVYMRFPEVTDSNPRIVLFLHGNGGQDMKGKATLNVIKFTKEMQKEGDPIILVAPQDGWGNFYPEGPEKKERGNWHDFNDVDTLANLIDFTEGIAGKHATDITIASFSGGNLGVKKILRSLEFAKDKNPEAAELYKKIQQVAYFDSATGSGSQFLANWMKENPKATVKNCFNGGTQYDKGSEIMLEALISQGIDSDRANSKKMKWGYRGHGIFKKYYQDFVGR